MLPESPSPRAALALSDLQPQTGASTFAVGTGSGNWSTHGVGGIGGDAYMDKPNNGGGLFGGNNRHNNQDRPFENPFQHQILGGGSSSQGGLFGNK